MTTTHTFQGLNADSKPSSRVLNPPGGSSSNIFGFDDQPKKYGSARSNLESVTKGTSDVPSYSPAAATAASQQKPVVPKSGDDNFHSPFGIYQSSGCDKAPSNNGVISSMAGVQISKLDTTRKNCHRSKYSDSNSFVNLFGEGLVQQRKMFRRVHKTSDDSFSRVFGQSCLLDCNEGKEGALNASVTSADKLQSGDVKSGLAAEITINTSRSNSCNIGSRFGKREYRTFPVDPVFRKSGFMSGSTLLRRLSPISAFNPITGEPYELSKPKQEAPVPTVIPSESKFVLESASVVESTGAENIAEPRKTQSVAPLAVSASTTTSISHQKQQQSGTFGIGSLEDVKEHRSTRVTQPPGGRSTKLW